MNDPLPIALVTTLHDPEGRLAPLAAPFLKGWKQRYGPVLVWSSPDGAGDTGALLESLDIPIVYDTAPQGFDQMGSVRLRALQAASAAHSPYYFLIDFDRLVHWEQHNPDELRRVEQGIPGYDFFILGRTERAFSTHPYVQRITEEASNAAFAACYGEALDITAGARGLSLRAIHHLSQRSSVPHLGVDGEWPLLCRQAGLQLGYFAAEGLEWETADRYVADIASLGYETWLDLHVNTPQNWEKRLRVAHQIATATCDLLTPNHHSVPG